MAKSAGTLVEHRLAKLEHMNSSSLVVLMRFITEARARGLAVRVVYDGDSRWQRMSFAVLHRLTDAGVPLEVVAD